MTKGKVWNYFFGIFLVIYIGVSSSINNKIAILPLVGIPLVLLLYRYGIVRLLFVCIGSLLIFQSSANFGSTKLLFLVGLIFVVLISFTKIIKYISMEQYKYARRIIYTGIIFAVYLVFNIFIGMLKGINYLDGFRDCSSYIIFAIAPIMALDFSINIKEKHLKWSIILIGVYATIICVYTWTIRRYGFSITTTSIGFANYTLPYLFFVFCCVNALKGNRKNILWALACVLIFASLALTGTRTTFGVIPFSFLVILFYGKEISLHKKLRTFLKVIIFTTITSVLSIFLLISCTKMNMNTFLGRIQLSSVILNFNSLNSDQSYIERKSQTNSAIYAIKQSPIIGVGSGYQFLTEDYMGKYEYRQSIDSPLSLVAKHGIIGYVFYIVILIQIYMYVKKIELKGENKMSSYYLIGFLAVAIITSMILTMLEDKGASIGMMLLLSLSFLEDKKYNTIDVVKSINNSSVND